MLRLNDQTRRHDSLFFKYSYLNASIVLQEQLRNTQEKRMQNTISELELEKTTEITQLQKKIDALEQQIGMKGQQYDDALRRAENDKQQALLLGECILHRKSQYR